MIKILHIWARDPTETTPKAVVKWADGEVTILRATPLITPILEELLKGVIYWKFGFADKPRVVKTSDPDFIDRLAEVITRGGDHICEVNFSLPALLKEEEEP